MTNEQVKKIMDLIEGGCIPRIENRMYVDGFAWVFENEEVDGEFMIQSQVWAARPLKSYDVHEIKLYRPEEIK